MHREILGLDDPRIIDHKNGNGLDNKRENIRFTDHTGNAGNIRIVGSRSGFKGVHRLPRCLTKPWSAVIRLETGQVRLGTFSTPEAAAAAYDLAAKKRFGEFAATNADLGLLGNGEAR